MRACSHLSVWTKLHMSVENILILVSDQNFTSTQQLYVTYLHPDVITELSCVSLPVVVRPVCAVSVCGHLPGIWLDSLCCCYNVMGLFSGPTFSRLARTTRTTRTTRIFTSCDYQLTSGGGVITANKAAEQRLQFCSHCWTFVMKPGEVSIRSVFVATRTSYLSQEVERLHLWS